MILILQKRKIMPGCNSSLAFRTVEVRTSCMKGSSSLEAMTHFSLAANVQDQIRFRQWDYHLQY